MTLWLDKYKPLSFNNIDYHKEQAKNIKDLVSTDNFPHLLVFGPPGAGKKTRINCILREIYGENVEKLRIQNHESITPSNKKIDVNLVVSNYHIEVNPSEAGFYDKVIVQDLIKNSGSFEQLEKFQQREYKIIVIQETEKLSVDAQHALRRTMEKYMKTCRLILCANSTSRIIPAIRSRCFPIRVSAPSVTEIHNILESVCKKEELKLPKALGRRIAEKSEGNLRTGLLMLEMCHIQQYPFTDSQPIELPEWHEYIKQTAAVILKDQTPQSLLEVRSRLNELLVHSIPPVVILKNILEEVVPHCEPALQKEVYMQAAQYEYEMRLGDKVIFHLEAFVAKFMSLFKTSFDEMFMDDDWQ